jgi:hypothetical protein
MKTKSTNANILKMIKIPIFAHIIEKLCNTSFKTFESVITNPTLLVRKQDVYGAYTR